MYEVKVRRNIDLEYRPKPPKKFSTWRGVLVDIILVDIIIWSIFLPATFLAKYRLEISTNNFASERALLDFAFAFDFDLYF